MGSKLLVNDYKNSTVKDYRPAGLTITNNNIDDHASNVLENVLRLRLLNIREFQPSLYVLELSLAVCRVGVGVGETSERFLVHGA